MKVCASGEKPLCCITSYEYTLTKTDGRFSLGVFEGTHYKDGSVRESRGYGICTVLKCNSNTSTLCDSYVSQIILINT